MTRVGLVLGAGGIVGQAYHAGVLAALELDLGWDPRQADIIVGTSAGSVTGATLRLGVAARDLAAGAVGVAFSPDGAPTMEALSGDAEQDHLPPFDLNNIMRRWRPLSPAFVAHAARRPWAFRADVALSTMLPAGKVDIAERTRVLDVLVGDRWPDGLWICAARRNDGKRVVFGRPRAPVVRLSEAVAASCAIPGYLSPIRIGGVQYIDGGIHSPTNADVLADQDLDVVVVISPMSAAHGRASSSDRQIRRSVHERSEREVSKLTAKGVEVIRIEPGPRSIAAMGTNAMADDRSDKVARAAFFDTSEYESTARVASRLAKIATRPARKAAAPSS